MKKELIGVFILIILTFFVSSQTVVEVPQQQAQNSAGYLSQAFSFLTSGWVVGFIIILAIVIALLIGAFFLVKWLVQFIKKRNDIFYKVRKERIKLAGTHRRYPAKHWLKVHKNTPVRLVRVDDNGKLTISSPIGYYKGDYTTSEGTFIIAMNIIGYKFWWFFPTTEVLVVPNREEVVLTSDKRNPKDKTQTVKLPLARDIVQFNESEVLLFAESINDAGMFFVPVLKSKDGKVINLTLPTYESLKDVALGNFLYTQTDEFSKLSKRALEINPYIRAGMKLSDSSQSVEIPSTRGSSEQ